MIFGNNPVGQIFSSNGLFKKMHGCENENAHHRQNFW